MQQTVAFIGEGLCTMDEKITVGIISAIVGGGFATLASYVSARFRMKELEFRTRRKHAEGELQAARTKLDSIYRPLIAKTNSVKDAFDAFKHNEDGTTRAAFLNSIDELKELFGTTKSTGDSIYLISSVESEIENVLKLVENSASVTKVHVAFITELDAFGLKGRSKTVHSKWVGLFVYMFVFFLEKFKFIYKRAVPGYLINTSMRTHSAPFTSADFALELESSIDTVHSISRTIALSSLSADNNENR